jgi:hypothetical protein
VSDVDHLRADFSRNDLPVKAVASQLAEHRQVADNSPRCGRPGPWHQQAGLSVDDHVRHAAHAIATGKPGCIGEDRPIS